MEPTSIPPGNAAPGIPQVPDPAAPPPAAPSVPAVPPTTPVMAQRGAIFAGVTLVDVGMYALITMALVVAMYSSYQQLMTLRKQGLAERAEIDEIKANLQSVMGENYEAQGR